MMGCFPNIKAFTNYYDFWGAHHESISSARPTRFESCKVKRIMWRHGATIPLLVLYSDVS